MANESEKFRNVVSRFANANVGVSSQDVLRHYKNKTLESLTMPLKSRGSGRMSIKSGYGAIRRARTNLKKVDPAHPILQDAYTAGSSARPQVPIVQRPPATQPTINDPRLNVNSRQTVSSGEKQNRHILDNRGKPHYGYFRSGYAPRSDYNANPKIIENIKNDGSGVTPTGIHLSKQEVRAIQEHYEPLHSDEPHITRISVVKRGNRFLNRPPNSAVVSNHHRKAFVKMNGNLEKVSDFDVQQYTNWLLQNIEGEVMLIMELDNGRVTSSKFRPDIFTASRDLVNKLNNYVVNDDGSP